MFSLETLNEMRSVEMETFEGIEARRISRLVGGLLLAFVGTVFVLGNLGVVRAGRLGDWWPLVLVWLGLSKMLAPTRPNRFGGGLVLLALGVFFQLERLDWISVSLRDVWPGLLIAAGIGLIAESLLSRGERRAYPSAAAGAGRGEVR
jgi:hypothetical protein